MTEPYHLYGAPISYYTGKARAYLRYKAIAFEEHPATREVYREVIVPRVGRPVIPVVVTPEGETLQDTTEIIDALEVRFPSPSVYPEGPVQRLVALLLEVYGDEWLKIAAMHYRWNHNSDWIVREFGRLSAPHASEAEQIEIGERTCRPFRGSLPALGIAPETHRAIETSYEALLGELDAHFAEHPFLLGTRPSIGDFGLFGPLYAHNYRDPASGALMERLAPNVVAWVKRMHDPEPRSGDFLPGDLVPETLEPVLARMVEEQFPVLQATRRAFEAWNAEHPQADLPRTLGTHPFVLRRGTPEEARGERAVFPFDLWMFQRAQDHFAALDAPSRSTARTLLVRLGGLDALAEPIDTRLAHRDFRLVRTGA